MDKLKVGDIITFRHGYKGVYCEDNKVTDFNDGTELADMSEYRDDLTSVYDEDGDVMLIERPQYLKTIFKRDLTIGDRVRVKRDGRTGKVVARNESDICNIVVQYDEPYVDIHGDKYLTGCHSFRTIEVI